MRATEISQRLADQVESVVRYLLPKGRRVGNEWQVGSLSGEPGESLSVHVGQGKPGVWSDFATGESGDLIGLWMACRSLSLSEACSEALAHLGIREETIKPAHVKSYKRPTRDGVTTLTDAHMSWLTQERKLPPESITAYRLASRGDRLMFPFIDPAGELVFAKYRRLPKQFSADAECEPILFGWQAIPRNARSVVICEGELDAVAWHAYGYPALSVPTGAGAHAWLEREFDRLARFDAIFVAMDGDEAGQAGVADLCERLGRDRAYAVTLPAKDANECLMINLSRDVIRESIRSSATLDPSELRSASQFEDNVWSEFTRKDAGLCLPWRKTWDTLKLRPGETSIWAGVNGHGKSAVVANVVSDLISHDTRCCVASMEYRTPMWLAIMHKIIAGTGNISEAFSRHISRTVCQNLWAFHTAGGNKAARILEVFRYARQRYGIDLFVIDNLTKCGFDDDDYTGQKRFVEDISDFCRDTGAHTMIVAHMRKSEAEDRPLGKMGVKGSGGITDMADTVVEVWRNKPREKALALATETGEPVNPKFADQSDTLIMTHKQRATGKEPTFGLWFDPDSTQFLSAAGQRPRRMVDFSVLNGAAA